MHMGPKKSMPTEVNGGSSGVSWSSGRSAIIFCQRTVLYLQHMGHLLIIFRTKAWPLTIQYLSRKLVSTYSWPKRPTSSWCSMMSSLDTWWLLGNRDLMFSFMINWGICQPPSNSKDAILVSNLSNSQTKWLRTLQSILLLLSRAGSLKNAHNLRKWWCFHILHKLDFCGFYILYRELFRW